MQKTKALTIAVIALIVINLALVAIIWLRPILMSPPKPPQQRTQRYMFEHLNLDDEQRKVIGEMRKKHMNLRKKQEMQLVQTRAALMDEVFSSPVDTLRINELLSQIGTTQKELDEGLVYHVREMRTVLQPSQQKELEQLFRRMMQVRHPDAEGEMRRKARMPVRSKNDKPEKRGARRP